MDVDQANALIRAFGEMIGMQDLVLDDSGSCTFEVDESNLAISIVHDEGSDSLILMMSLPNVSLNDEIAQSLLEANFIGGVGNGAYFAVEPDSGTVYLVRKLGPISEPQILAQAMQTMIEMAGEWQEEFADSAPELDHVEEEVEQPIYRGFEPGIRV